VIYYTVFWVHARKINIVNQLVAVVFAWLVEKYWKPVNASVNLNLFLKKFFIETSKYPHTYVNSWWICPEKIDNHARDKCFYFGRRITEFLSIFLFGLDWPEKLIWNNERLMFLHIMYFEIKQIKLGIEIGMTFLF